LKIAIETIVYVSEILPKAILLEYLDDSVFFEIDDKLDKKDEVIEEVTDWNEQYVNEAKEKFTDVLESMIDQKFIDKIF
jgi:hypothetical protein